MSLGDTRKVTREEAARLVDRFRKQYPYLFTQFIPSAKAGGTFLYCPGTIKVERDKLDKIGRRTGRKISEEVPCPRRFRRYRTYRTHYRRNHRGLDSS